MHTPHMVGHTSLTIKPVAPASMQSPIETWFPQKSASGTPLHTPGTYVVVVAVAVVLVVDVAVAEVEVWV